MRWSWHMGTVGQINPKNRIHILFCLLFTFLFFPFFSPSLPSKLNEISLQNRSTTEEAVHAGCDLEAIYTDGAWYRKGGLSNHGRGSLCCCIVVGCGPAVKEEKGITVNSKRLFHPFATWPCQSSGLGKDWASRTPGAPLTALSISHSNNAALVAVAQRVHSKARTHSARAQSPRHQAATNLDCSKVRPASPAASQAASSDMPPSLLHIKLHNSCYSRQGAYSRQVFLISTFPEKNVAHHYMPGIWRE
jgi:hypothetical protein